MGLSLDLRYGKLIKRLRLRIRNRLFLCRTAVHWHLKNARGILSDPQCIGVSISYMDDLHEKKHRILLPSIIKKIERLDERCNASYLRGDKDQFLSKLQMLSRQFLRLRFDLKMYERLGRAAPDGIVSACENSAADRALPEFERTMRMTPEQYNEILELNRLDIARIDLNRKKFINHYAEFARKIAHKRCKKSKVYLDAAYRALHQAAVNYNHERGYQFRTYAVWWVKRGLEIEDQRQANPEGPPPLTWNDPDS